MSTPPEPTSTTGPKTGSTFTPRASSSAPRAWRWIRKPSSARPGTAARTLASMRRHASATAARSDSPRATPPTSDLWGRAAAQAFTTTG